MKPLYWVAKSFFWVYFKILYRVKIYGADRIPNGCGILASNHASFLDPPFIAVSYPREAAFLAKKRLFKNGFINFLFENMNVYPVGDDASNLHSFKVIMKLLAEDQKVIVFPEGFRSTDGNLLPLKTGVAMIAMRTDCPIIPVYIHGSYEAWPRDKKFPQFGTKLACVFGSPLYPKDFKELDKKKAQEELTRVLSEKILGLKSWYLAGAVEPVP